MEKMIKEINEIYAGTIKEYFNRPNKLDECHFCGKHFFDGVGFVRSVSALTGNDIFICKSCAKEQKELSKL